MKAPSCRWRRGVVPGSMWPGEIVANGRTLKAGDALALSDEVAVKLSNGKTPKCWCLT